MSFVLPPFANATTNKYSPTREMNTLFNKFRQNSCSNYYQMFFMVVVFKYIFNTKFANSSQSPHLTPYFPNLIFTTNNLASLEKLCMDFWQVEQTPMMINVNTCILFIIILSRTIFTTSKVDVGTLQALSRLTIELIYLLPNVDCVNSKLTCVIQNQFKKLSLNSKKVT